MTTTFLNLPPHLLPSSTPPLSGTPSGQNTSTPPHLHRSLVPPVDKIPPHFLNSTTLWYPQWTKYLHTFSPPHLHTSTPPHLLTSTPPHLHRSLVPPVDKIPPPLLNSTTLWRPKWPPLCSLAAQVVLFGAPSVAPTLFGASRGNLHCSLAPLAENDAKISFIYYFRLPTSNSTILIKSYF